MPTLLAVRGLAATTPAFKRAHLNMAERLDMNADYLAAVYSFETIGTFNPAERNKQSGAIGLIQFTTDAAAIVGTTQTALAEMTGVEQLVYVEKYLSPVKGGLHTLADHYMAVFSPRGIGKPDDFGLYFRDASTAKERRRYTLNAALDSNGNGIITVGEAVAPVARIVATAETLPRLDVPEEPLVSAPQAIGGGFFILLMFILGIRRFKKNVRLKT